MEFFVRCFDGADKDAKARRDAARPTHLAKAAQLAEEGKILFAGAILDENKAIIGSALFCDFASRKELDEWLAVEPLVTYGVWQRIEVNPCMLGKAYSKKSPDA